MENVETTEPSPAKLGTEIWEKRAPKFGDQWGLT